MDNVPFIILGSGILMILMAIFLVSHTNALVREQVLLLNRAIRNALDVADANIDMGHNLVECHQAWSKAQDIHQCSTCRANSLLRGAKFSG
jgi:hypothetical protein